MKKPWPAAGPGQSQGPYTGLGLAKGLRKPKPPQAEPKPGLPGQAGPEHHGTVRSDEILDGVSGSIGACTSSVDARDLGLRERILYYTGNTPLVRINSLRVSDALGVEILGKAEVRQGC